MEWRWIWFWSVIWNILIHAVTFNWGALAGDAEAFKSWWRSLWSEVENRLTDLRNWANGRISWLQGYAFGLVYQLGMEVARSITSVRVFLESLINGLRSWAQGQISWLTGLAYGLYNQAISFARGILEQAIAWARPYINAAISVIHSLYSWIQPYRDLIVNFLAGARGVIQWLWHTAWGQLQAFLANPVGFVLGWLLTPVINLINWWQRYGPLLMNYVANELAEWYTIWRNGKRILKALVDNPERFVFDLIAPRFLDWLAQLIADNW